MEYGAVKMLAAVVNDNVLLMRQVLNVSGIETLIGKQGIN